MTKDLPNSSLITRIGQEIISNLHGCEKYRLHCLSTSPSTDSPIVHSNSHVLTIKQERLILLSEIVPRNDPTTITTTSTTTTTNNNNNNNSVVQKKRTPSEKYIQEEEVFVFAMKTSEYNYKENNDTSYNLIYIEKIDSSGYGSSSKSLTSKSPCRSVVAGYLSSISDFLPPGNTRIHIFSRSQPQYLFHKSIGSHKNVLNDIQLMRWWSRTLSVCHWQSNVQKNGFWFVPGEDANTMPKPPAGNHILWHWGHPFLNGEKALASKVIPRFEDDIKLKTLQFSTDPNTTINEFFQILSLSGECSAGRTAAIFVIDLGQTKRMSEIQERLITSDEFKVYLSDLMNDHISNYSTKDLAASSTTTFLDRIKKSNGYESYVFQLQGKPDNPVDGDKKRCEFNSPDNVKVSNNLKEFFLNF